MDPFFDLDELFGDLNPFDNRFMKRLQERMNEIEKAVKSGKLKGNWDFKQIDKPGVKGYIIQGRFWTDEPFEMNDPFEPFEPLRPSKRRPMPERPLKVPEGALKEAREPLTDIFEQDGALKVYVELPGEEEADIQLNFNEGKIEVKAKKFYKMIDLPTLNVDKDKMTTKYKNGVLEITIPKRGEHEPELHRL